MNDTDLTAFCVPASAAEIAARACELEEKSSFLTGLSERLRELGVPCSTDDTEIMFEEIRSRYKAILGKPCPRTVLEWIRGTTPGFSNRQNNYELCMALEMNFEQTAVFFSGIT